MPVIKRERLEKIYAELLKRFDDLANAVEPRALTRPNEGCARGQWVSPETMAATRVDDLALRLLVSDFGSILAEIKKLK